MPQIERRLAAIMLADIAGYSTLMERAEARTYERVRALREELVDPTVARYAGRIVKTTGDGFLAEFSSGTAALLCGIDIQRLNLSRESARDPGERLHLRIGINLGDIIIDGNDVSGDGVNVAARLEPLAPNDGICISGAVRDQVREDLDVVFEDLGEQHVKNIARPIRAFRIHLAGTAAPETVARSRNAWKWWTSAVATLAFLSLAGVALWVHDTSTEPGASIPVDSGAPRSTFEGIRITSALIIGNGKYANHYPLENARNDAIAISTSLKLQGIPVTLKLDLGDEALHREIASFRKQGDANSVQLFFYSGHGYNLKGSNFLFPVDAPAAAELLAGKALSKVNPVTDIYQDIPGKMIVLLDTHGDPVSVPDNVVLTFSGSPKNPTLDSYLLADGTESPNSPYAASIIEMLSGAEENLPTAFLRLAQRVDKKTRGQQIPWVSGTIVGAGAWGAKAARN